MANRKKVNEAVKWYQKERSKYINLKAEVEKILKEALNENEIIFHSIESRVKSVNSFREKALREKYDDPVTEITDLTGIRIITLFEKEIHQISDIIKELFKIDYEKSEDKSDLLDADKMGYKSIHYIAELSQEKIYATDLESFSGIKFEIQIRSILQHAWAEIEHDRNYKFKGKLPKHLQRRFYALAGMLEIADREFNTLSEEVEKFRQNKNN
ncbi:ppGpp synthetase catalytic domain-containing protein (RelA/SpoT-type nucleotidyltranferase) [Halanaerobium congolense]|uniref:PpGpp synthetase catalytic domain-containing protein (RelA/SpoT-type nucleotidyltranferase) n=1 Tax=Halanaerobium congolense TaxID=54121 RepID=A0A1G8K7D6_9FIRM|nr:RelA/SpoT [Halanaerobium congolense]OEG63279.1 MAG: RelA/SpoT [Halanaerobium sp. MDAL1]PUU93576.1 MAG: RelA/SpoT domain-containing protein [Halanaerobium sp.]TDS26071.1 ppGpp synthetase/RelA/SpoT-type nucleotidyltransferase [Halanaerobium congolense]TDX45491.1 ppGpp synthetase/RelA/SpoT-type nucleotidyltransferase [Halanaerobium congolense]SDI39331.1 ppGpp synthetase catalytic domain-containing protein (RelA/SpoT-type nucleotidyltranferase) [Halanaerobium congolense]